MQQILYTQEGKKYIVRTVNKINQGVILGSEEQFNLYAVCNPDSFFVESYYNIVFATNKKIIPISFNFGAIEAGTRVIADVQPVYAYCQIQGSNPKCAGNNTYLSKMFPYVTQDYFTDLNHYAYSYKYKEIIYSDSDFIDTVGPLYVYATPSKIGGLLGGALGTDNITLPAGAYNTSISFTYFEMIP